MISVHFRLKATVGLGGVRKDFISLGTFGGEEENVGKAQRKTQAERVMSHLGGARPLRGRG